MPRCGARCWPVVTASLCCATPSPMPSRPVSSSPPSPNGCRSPRPSTSSASCARSMSISPESSSTVSPRPIPATSSPAAAPWKTSSCPICTPPSTHCRWPSCRCWPVSSPVPRRCGSWPICSSGRPRRAGAEAGEGAESLVSCGWIHFDFAAVFKLDPPAGDGGAQARQPRAPTRQPPTEASPQPQRQRRHGNEHERQAEAEQGEPPPGDLDAHRCQPLVPQQGGQRSPRGDDRGEIHTDEQRAEPQRGVGERREAEIGGQVVDRVRAEGTDDRDPQQVEHPLALSETGSEDRVIALDVDRLDDDEQARRDPDRPPRNEP